MKGIYYNSNNEIVYCGNKKENNPLNTTWQKLSANLLPKGDLKKGGDFLYKWDGTDIIKNIDTIKKEKCIEVKNYLFNIKYNENFLYDVETDTQGIGDKWQIDELSQQQICFRALKAIASNADSATFPWTGDKCYWTNNETPNEAIEFTTADKFLLFADAVDTHCNALWKQHKLHKTAIRALTTEQDINNYDITTGW